MTTTDVVPTVGLGVDAAFEYDVEVVEVGVFGAAGGGLVAAAGVLVVEGGVVEVVASLVTAVTFTPVVVAH